MRPGGGIFQDSEQLWIKRDWAFSDDPRLSWRGWLVYERFSGHVMPEQCRHGRLSGQKEAGAEAFEKGEGDNRENPCVEQASHCTVIQYL